MNKKIYNNNKREYNNRRSNSNNKSRANNKPIISLIVTFAISLILVIGTTLINVEADKQDRAALEKQYIVVEIKSGDTLTALAKEYMGVGYSDLYEYISDIKSVNSMTTDDICSGDNIIIPLYVPITEL